MLDGRHHLVRPPLHADPGLQCGDDRGGRRPLGRRDRATPGRHPLSLLDECLAAYGGLERWRAADAVEVRVSARGAAFAMKGNGRPLTEARARVRTTGQHVEFFDWPRAGETAVLTSEETRIGDRSRERPRFGRRWDELDFLAFGGAAMWTYVSLPFVLADWGAEELPRRRLRFHVPEPIRSHCREQTIHLGERRAQELSLRDLRRPARPDPPPRPAQAVRPGGRAPGRARRRLGPVAPTSPSASRRAPPARAGASRGSRPDRAS